MKSARVVVHSLLLASCVQSVYAVDATASASDQIVQLNTQIQTQMKQIQDGQQQQIATLNTQIQTQIKQMQTDLQAQMQKLNSQSQAQIQQVQTALQTQIAQIQTQIDQIKKTA